MESDQKEHRGSEIVPKGTEKSEVYQKRMRKKRKKRQLRKGGESRRRKTGIWRHERGCETKNVPIKKLKLATQNQT